VGHIGHCLSPRLHLTPADTQCDVPVYLPV
jgi:hypothetical protein